MGSEWKWKVALEISMSQKVKGLQLLPVPETVKRLADQRVARAYSVNEHGSLKRFLLGFKFAGSQGMTQGVGNEPEGDSLKRNHREWLIDV